MKRHQVSWAQSEAGDGNGALGILGFISIAFASGGGLIVAPALWFLFIIPLIAVIALWTTNERFGMSNVEIKYWKKYRSLSKESQRAVPIDRDYFVKLDNGPEWDELRAIIHRLAGAEKEYKNAIGLENASLIKAAAEARYKEIKTDIKIVNEVHKELGY